MINVITGKEFIHKLVDSLTPDGSHGEDVSEGPVPCNDMPLFVTMYLGPWVRKPGLGRRNPGLRHPETIRDEIRHLKRRPSAHWDCSVIR